LVARYEMANRVHETLVVAWTYVVANPSSYAWPAAPRHIPSADAETGDAKDGWKSESVHTNFSVGPSEAGTCQNYDKWPLGLESRASGYTVKMSDDDLKKQLVS